MTLPWPATFAVETPDETSIVVRRDFGAPPPRVWRAMTEPAHMVQWLGTAEFPMTTCEMDVRVGGSYRWVFATEDGSGMGVSGSFHEVAPHTRLVSIEQFDAFPGPSTNTLVLSPAGDDGTAMRLSVVYPSREIRDGWVASGMTEGLGACYERLDGVLADG